MTTEAYKKWNKRNPGLASSRAHAWQKENPERYKEISKKCREKRIANGKHAADQANRRARKRNATVPWYEKEQVEMLYNVSRFFSTLNPFGGGYHVDHIIPLKGEDVCGLHCRDNLQILRSYDNVKKSNIFKGD